MKPTLVYGLAAIAVLAVAIGLFVLRGQGGGPGTRAVSAPAQMPPAGPIAGNGQPTLVEFGMNTCASCRAMHQVLDELSTTHGERLRIIRVNVMEQSELTREWKVIAIPTQVFLDGEGEELYRHLGFLSARAVRDGFSARGLPLATTPDGS